MFRQTLTNAIVGMTHFGSLQKPMASPPSLTMSWFTMPNWMSSIHKKVSAVTTFDTRYGLRMSDRTTVDFVNLCMRAAMRTARIVWTPMLMATYSTVTFREFQNLSSAMRAR